MNRDHSVYTDQYRRFFLKRPQHLFRGNRGISLVEVIVFIAISTIGALAVMGILYSATSYQKMFNDNSQRNAESRTLQLALQNFSLFGTLVNFAGNVSLNGTGSNAGAGFFRQYSYAKFADGNGNPEVLGYLLSENSISILPPTAIAPKVKPMALVFQPPTLTSPGSLLVFDKNSANLDPKDAVISLTGVVEVKLFNPIEVSGILSSIELQYTIRKALLKENVANDANKPRWCPLYDIKNTPACRDVPPYRDVTESVVLQFRNNRRNAPFNGTEYSKGIYFFRLGGT